MGMRSHVGSGLSPVSEPFSPLGPFEITGPNPMPVAVKSEQTCPECGYSGAVWAFQKRTDEVRKECFTCPTCGDEWSHPAD